MFVGAGLYSPVSLACSCVVFWAFSVQLPYLGMPIYGEPRAKVCVCSDIKSCELLCSTSCVSVFSSVLATKYYIWRRGSDFKNTMSIIGQLREFDRAKELFEVYIERLEIS